MTKSDWSNEFKEEMLFKMNIILKKLEDIEAIFDRFDHKRKNEKPKKIIKNNG